MKEYEPKPSLNYIKQVLKQNPHYRHYAADVRWLIKQLEKCKRELGKLKRLQDKQINEKAGQFIDSFKRGGE